MVFLELLKFGLPLPLVFDVLVQRKGSLFVDWDQKLFHAMKMEHFKTLVSTSTFRFNSDKSFYDPLEKISAATAMPEYSDIEAKSFDDEFADELFFCHCWYSTESHQSSMFHANDSTPKQIIIQTTFRALFDSVLSEEVSAGIVSYRNLVEFNRSSLPLFQQKFIKHESWRNEEEFRLVISRRKKPLDNPDFLPVKVDLKNLIREVILRHSERASLEALKRSVRDISDEIKVSLSDGVQT